MTTKEAFFEMAEKFDMKDMLVEIGKISPEIPGLISEWFSWAVLMANTKRHNAIADYVFCEARGERSQWNPDNIGNVGISSDEIDDIHQKFLEIALNCVKK